jgi:hypothetical protein
LRNSESVDLGEDGQTSDTPLADRLWLITANFLETLSARWKSAFSAIEALL